ncbi:MAG: metalloregulator ArsR/SmtB family transcription factor [Bacteroidales bacterium]|jgi:DNA-binding transcriptional ArsR family regulator
MKLSDLTPEQLETAANMLKAMAHPMRIAILRFLEGNNSLTVTEIYEKLGIEQSTTSHHLGILKDKGVLQAKRVGKNTYYSLRNNNLSSIIDCLSKCSAISTNNQ